MPDGTTRFWTLDEKPIYKSIGCAAFSEYTVMSIETIVVVDKRAELENNVQLVVVLLRVMEMS